MIGSEIVFIWLGVWFIGMFLLGCAATCIGLIVSWNRGNDIKVGDLICIPVVGACATVLPILTLPILVADRKDFDTTIGKVVIKGRAQCPYGKGPKKKLRKTA